MIYFDNSATTKPFGEVLDTFVKVNQDYYANPSSLHHLGGQVEKLINAARRQISELIGIKPNELFFTSGGTESNNSAIKGVVNQYFQRGNHLITSQIEHPSVLETFKSLEKRGFVVTYLPVDSTGRVSAEDLKKAITDQTILVSIMHVNNEVGTIQSIEEFGRLLNNYPKIAFHVDHVQGFGKIPIDYHRMNIDLATMSGHKINGLKGTGLLYKREGLVLSPLIEGGSQEKSVRSGTENTGGIVALAKAVRLTFEKREETIKLINQIMGYLRDELIKEPGVVLHTDSENASPHILNLSVKGYKGEVLVHALAKEGVFVSTTSACSSKQTSVSHTLMAMGVSKEVANSSIRISLGAFNTLAEANQFVRSLKLVKNQLVEVGKRTS
jgi:cysteine desulfurase